MRSVREMGIYQIGILPTLKVCLISNYNEELKEIKNACENFTGIFYLMNEF